MDFNKLIESSQSSDLQELHQLIFRGRTHDMQIKENLKKFRGFNENDMEEIVQYAVTTFDTEELVDICLKLSINPMENSMEDARQIVKKLSKTKKIRNVGQESSQDFGMPLSSDSLQSTSLPQHSNSTISQLQQQSSIIHELRKQLIDLEEVQLELDENSAEFVKVSKKILFMQKKLSLEEKRKLELQEENKLQSMEFNSTNPSSSSLHTSENRHLYSLLLKTPQNLKLNNFDGSSCLDWHYFLLQYNSSSTKYNLSNDENLIRLNEHLKGDARQKVDLLLKSSKDPSGIIKILETHYGGTKRVTNEILKRAKNIKQVISLEHFKDYNCTLQNISSVISQRSDNILDCQRLLTTLLERLPDHLISQWANFIITKGLDQKNISFTVFSDWINRMSEVLTEVTFNKSTKDLTFSSGLPSTSKNEEKTYNTSCSYKLSSLKNCKLCEKEVHPLFKCSQFKALDAKKRFMTTRKLNFCIYCLNKHFGFCKKRKLCSIDNCTKYHHELLHEQQNDKPKDVSAFIQNRSVVLLKMLPINLKVNNKVIKLLAFLDDGSTLSLMDKSTADEIGLLGDIEPISFQWTADIYREDDTSRNLSLEISGENSSIFHKIDNVHTVEDLKLPEQRININKLLESFPELKNVNISSSYAGCPVLLLGQRHANLITNRQTIQIPNGGPFVSKTTLGWAVHGPVNISGKEIESFLCIMAKEDSLEEMISQQFKLENIDLDQSKNDSENEKVVSQMENSITKCENYYEIGLPWKENIIELPNSLPLAKQRLMHLERTLLKDKKLLHSYQTQINSLLEKNYARKIQFADLKGKSKYWILPHFPVHNPKKPHKPARIVFDAAAKVQNKCLNDFLNTGPDWLCSIIGILFRFRQNKIGFTGDICEMFNRVKIKDIDTFAQCFLWRDVDQRKPIELYQMKAMLFGLNCAPFIAQYVKNYNAAQYKESYPDAFQAITQSHYVDDFVESRDDLDETIALINDVIKVHSYGGFQIRSFISNNTELIHHIPKELVSADMFKIGEINIQKVLGMFWDTKTDNFLFLFQFFKTKAEVLSGTKMPTKKEFLQILMTIYDPLGLLTPIVIKGKILFQSIWKSKVDWDQTIPIQFKKKLLIWLEEINKFKELNIPRCYKTNILKPKDVQLHIFCDASNDSYCSVAYIRLQDTTNIEISLVYSKARVAPLSNKSLTIPKLELMACVLGIRIANMIKQHLDISSTYFWTDSMVVLAWLNSKKYLRVFERNRVDEIMKTSKTEDWNWVPSEENIADFGTRDKQKILSNDCAWFKGPAFLHKNTSCWINFFKKPIAETNFPDKVYIIIENSYIRKKLTLPDIERFNNLHYLLKVTSWVIRYMNNLKAKINNLDTTKETYVTIPEIENAKQLWIKNVQQERFKDDIDKLFNISSGSKSRLSRYNYKLDQNNILRLGGRYRSHSFLNENVINPIILDGDHKFTKLLVINIHLKYQHFSIQSVIHEFRSTYWMPKMTSKIKQIIKKCLHCRLMNPQSLNPPTGNLIPERLRFFEKSFTAVGIDYFGPFHVKAGRKIYPRYGVLFTCLTTRATHVEIAHTLTADSCLMSIRRMMARRGQIRLMMSDNATNFKGASSELRKILQDLDRDEIGEGLVKYGIEWKFIPSQTPHFGGCWERMIGSFKKAISAVIPQNHNLNDEMLSTIFAETEYILNTRPYILESDDPRDKFALSPMDILIPKFIEMDPLPSNQSTSIYHQRQWRICENIIDNFWNRFIKEYIPSILTSKLRKYSKDTPITVGNLVYIKNKIDRGKWPIGKVENVFPGKDGAVRIAEIKFGGSKEKMSVRNLLKISIDNNLI